MEQLGIVDILALAAVIDSVFGPEKSKRMGAATKNTSNLSILLRKWLPQKFGPGIRFPTVTGYGRPTSTKIVGVAIARWIPVLGLVLLANDVVKIAECTVINQENPPIG